MKNKLRERIRELASIGVSERLRRRKLSGEERHQERLEYLCTTRFEARHTLLAYAFLRGIPYRSVERKVLEKPSYYKIAGILEADPQEVLSWLSKESAKETRERLGWTPLSEAQQEANLEHNLSELGVC